MYYRYNTSHCVNLVRLAGLYYIYVYAYDDDRNRFGDDFSLFFLRTLNFFLHRCML